MYIYDLFRLSMSHLLVSRAISGLGLPSPTTEPDSIVRRSNIWRANGRIENGRRNRHRGVTRDDADEVSPGAGDEEDVGRGGNPEPRKPRN